jgi:hypothetical protein
MKKIQLIIICLFFIISKSDAQVTIGSENLVDKRLPIELSSNYNYTQTIYLSSEIYTSGNITSLAYYATPTTVISNANNWTIYLGHTTKSTFSSTSDWIPNSNLTQVFSGVVTLSAGVATIIFDTPFAYNGIDNLVVAIYENTPSANSPSDDFYCTATSGNRALSLRAAVNSINPSSPATASSIVTAIANITFGGISHPGPPPNNLTVLENTTNSANLSWTENGTATKWNIQWDTTGFVLGAGNVINDITTNPFNLTGLDPGRYYQFYVQANYDASGVSYWAGPYSFYTIGIPQFKFHLAFEDATGAKDTVWLILDTLAIGNDIIFGEIPISLPINTFQVYIELGINDIRKVVALPSNQGLYGFAIRSQNYVYPIKMYWDTSLIFNNNLPFDINVATLDNEFFFFSNNDPNLHHQYSMMFEDSIEIEPFSWGSQDHFPIDFAIGYDPNYGVGIRKEKEAASITIYPNPVTTMLVIKHKNNYKETSFVRLTDVMGNIVRQEIFSSNELNLDIMNLPQGFYFIEVFNNDFRYKEKIIKY